MINISDNFSTPEINLMCIFDTSNRDNLLSELHQSLADVYDPDMREIMEDVIGKLQDITDTEFWEIGFFIADDFSAWEE